MATLGVAADWRDVALVLAVRLALQIGGLPATAAATTGSTE
jgi:lipoyl(octanoyl) transferase